MCGLGSARNAPVTVRSEAPMRKLLGCAVLGALLFTPLPLSVVAQRRAAARPAGGSAQRPSFGPELNWSSDVDFGIGARGVFPLQSLFPKTPLDGIVSFDYFFPSHTTCTGSHYWEINGNVATRFTVQARSSFRPYAGGGLNIIHASSTVTIAGQTVSGSDTKAGLNLLGGTTFKLKGSKLTPFAEARGEIGGGETFILPGGVRVWAPGSGAASRWRGGPVSLWAGRRFDFGFKAGFFDPPGPGHTELLLGAEARQRVITHTVDFPLDGALLLGVGGNFVSGSSVMLIPAGLSLGRRIDPQGSTVSIVPYVEPTVFLLAGDATDHVQFSLGLGADFRLSRVFDARVSAGLGDVEGVSIGAVWEVGPEA